MWSDNETTEDLLGFKVHADLLFDVIKDDNVLPISIGVFGDWGGGKSSILQIIKAKFEEKKDEEYIEKDTLCIYFNGWTFEGYDDAKAALLNAILKELEDNKKLGAEIKETVKEKAKKLWKSIDWMRGAGMVLKNVALPAISAYFTGGMSLIPFIQQKFSEFGNEPQKILEYLQSEKGKEVLSALKKEKQGEEKTNAVAEFKKDFEELLEATKFKRLVVIIDDLDRCTPERIIENLEAVKLFLNVPKTAFIIGADPRIVRHAIEFKYKTDKIAYSTDEQIKNDRIVSDYLEKLIQIPYNLPKLSDNEVETYLTLLLCKKSFLTKFPQILAKYEAHNSNDKHSVFGFGNIKEILSVEENEDVGKNISILASSSKIITNGLKGNPRQIKRFLNTYVLRERLIKVAKLTEHVKMDVLAKIMVLEYSNIDLFRELYNWQSKSEKKGEPEEIKLLEQLSNDYKKEEIGKQFSINWSKDEVLNWLNSEPKLSGIDLRDYYWISRDQLSDSISASSMLSKEIRDLRNKILGFSSDKELSSLVKNKVLQLQESDLKTLLGLFEKELLIKSNEEVVHKIFIELMSQKVMFAIDTYLKVIKQIDTTKIPSHISSPLKMAIAANKEIQIVIDELNKHPKTKISISLKA